jgi:hypothetical protein
VFDKNKNDYLDAVEFIEGMSNLFSESYEKLASFIFDFYDFDKDEKISKDDIRVVLSYIPLNTQKYNSLRLKFEKEDFKDRIESQDEIHALLEKCFKNTETLDKIGFLNVIENVSSEIFLYILIFIMEKRPFTKKTLNEFEGQKKSSNLLSLNRTPTTANRLIASPNLQSKFSPSVTISKSPSMTKRNTLNVVGGVNNLDSKNLLSKLTGVKSDESKQVLLKYANSGKSNKDLEAVDTDEQVSIKNIPVNRKNRNNLKNLETNQILTEKKGSTSYENSDLPITAAVKHGLKGDE